MVTSSSTTVAPWSTIATFGELLKFLRRRAQLTQRDLAIAVGYSISQISRLEQNERLPDAMTLLAIFVPALGLEKEPDLTARLLALAQSAHAAPTALSDPSPPAAHHLEETKGEAERPPHNLPNQLTSFIGRSEETAAIVQQLATARLVTLTGVGGVGKTRLAVAAAQAMRQQPAAQQRHFPDGLWLVEFAALQDASLVTATILAAFHLPSVAGRAPLAALLHYLQPKALLLVLDNCEHLIATCADLVTQILRTCPQVTLLVTSREALNIDGEVEWPVKPLTTPPLPADTAPPPTAAAIRDFAAVQLFLARAQGARADWQLTDQNAPAVAQICTHLDGLPLAIELAAARLKAMSVAEIAAHLDDRFTLLTSGRRTALLRHQTLRATIDWSYDLLSEPERWLLRQLAVFSGGWTLAAAEALAGQLPQPTLPLLLQLVNKSLVACDESGLETRYHLLETVRQYATEKLCETHEQAHAQQAHFTYFVTLAATALDGSLIGPRLAVWLNHIVQEYDNLRVAFAWACQQPDRGERALRLAGALGLFWTMRGEITEGTNWLAKSLALDQGASSTTRAFALYYFAYLGLMIGQPHDAELQEAHNLFTGAQDQLGIACSSYALGATALNVLDYAQVIMRLEHGLQICRAQNYPRTAGLILWKLGDSYHANQQRTQAIACYEECIALGRRYGERLLLCRPLILLGAVDGQRALELCRAELQKPQPDREVKAALLQTLGRILEEQACYTEAKVALTEALHLWRQLRIKWSVSGGITRALLDLGTTCFWTHDDEATEHYMAEAQQHYTDVGDWHGVAWAQIFRGYAARRQGHLPRACAHFQASLRHSADIWMNYLPLSFCGLAETLAALGQTDAAFHLFGAATHFEDRLFALDTPARGLFLEPMAAARRQLCDPALAAAWAAGQAMGIEAAVAFGIAQEGGLPPVSQR